MDYSALVSCIGKHEDDPEVQARLSALGVTNKLKMPADDIDVRHVLQGVGLCLIFKPEGPKSSRLIFYAVQFVSSVEEGYSTFAGTLPAGLQFSDGQADAQLKLGTPLTSKPKLRRDIWRLDDLQLALKYSKNPPHQIAVVTVQLPLEA
jgi:hypothetical protein